MKTTRVLTLDQMVADQRRWIDERGGNVAGYVFRYGAATDPSRYGEGGERIYEADRAVLDELLARQRLDVARRARLAKRAARR